METLKWLLHTVFGMVYWTLGNSFLLGVFVLVFGLQIWVWLSDVKHCQPWIWYGAKIILIGYLSWLFYLADNV